MGTTINRRLMVCPSHAYSTRLHSTSVFDILTCLSQVLESILESRWADAPSLGGFLVRFVSLVESETKALATWLEKVTSKATASSVRCPMRHSCRRYLLLKRLTNIVLWPAMDFFLWNGCSGDRGCDLCQGLRWPQQYCTNDGRPGHVCWPPSLLTRCGSRLASSLLRQSCVTRLRESTLEGLRGCEDVCQESAEQLNTAFRRCFQVLGG